MSSGGWPHRGGVCSLGSGVVSAWCSLLPLPSCSWILLALPPLSLSLIQREGPWAFPEGRGRACSAKEEKELGGPRIAGWPSQTRGFNEEKTILGGKKGCSRFNFSLLAETNGSVKTMKYQGGVLPLSHSAPLGGKLCGQGRGGRARLPGQLPHEGWASRAGGPERWAIWTHPSRNRV